MMVGRELTNIFPKEDAPIGEVVLSVRNLTRKGIVEDVSFDLRRGEILGIAGLMGAGRTEVIEGIFGIQKIDAGEIEIKGKKVRISCARRCDPPWAWRCSPRTASSPASWACCPCATT